jgi:hypothetical protein
MKPAQSSFTQSSDPLLELKKGGGCMSLFGVPFFGAGLFMLLISLRVVPISNASELPWWAWLILAGMGIIFTGVGGVLVFGREWITVDNRQMRVWIAKGLIVPLRSSYYELQDFNSVCLSYVAGDSDTSDSYPIALVSSRGLPDLVLLSVLTYGEARKQALLLGEFLSYPITDCTTGNPQDMQDQVEMPQVVQRPPAPVTSRIELTETNDELFISIRHPGMTTARLLMGFIPFTIFMLFSYRFIGLLFSRGTPWMVRVIFLGFIGIFFVLIPLIGLLKRVLRRGSADSSMKISSQGIQLQDMASGKKLSWTWSELFGVDFSSMESTLQRGPQGRGHRAQFDPAKIPNWAMKLALLSGSRGLIIKAADGFHYFGRGLRDEELSYLHAIVNEAIIRYRPFT